MSFSKDAQFRINVAKKSFGSNFKNFKELIKEFTNSSIIEDITDFPLGKNSQFKEQFDFGAQFVRTNQFAHSLSPVAKNSGDWEKIIEMGRVYNPYTTFIVIQLVSFLSKKFPSAEVDFLIGYEKEYTRFVKLVNGKVVSQNEEQIIDPSEIEDNLLQLSLKDLVVMLKYLQSL
jgi:hypothetical protein